MSCSNSDVLWIGNDYLIKNDQYQEIISRLTENTHRTIEETDSFVDIHNAFVAYTVMMLFQASGHRPVKDPFCYKADFHLGEGLLICEDKVVSERHRFRLVSLPTIAVEQVQAYEGHLKWLVSHLMNESGTNNLECSVLRLCDSDVSKKKQNIPYFFFLEKNEKGVRCISISESSLEKHYGETYALAFNYSRRNLSTRLRQFVDLNAQSSFSIEVIEAHLGHMDGLRHPHGASSVMSPIQYHEQISKQIHELLNQDGWMVIQSKRYFSKHQKNDGCVVGFGVLGPIERLKTRLLRKSEDEEVVKVAIEKYSERELIEDPLNTRRIIESVVKNSKGNKSRLSIRLNILHRDLMRKRKENRLIKVPRKIYLPEYEASPFSENVIEDYKSACNIKQRFINLLQETGRNHYKGEKGALNYYSRVAEVIVSAVLFDGLHTIQRAKALIKSNFNLIREGDFTYCDLYGEKERYGTDTFIWRWYPQYLSCALVLGLKGGKLSKLRPKKLNQKILMASIEEVGVHIGLKLTRNSIMEELCHHAESYWIMHLPPFLREISNGNTPVQPFSEKTFVRILRNERLTERATGKVGEKKDNDINQIALNYARLAKDINNNLDKSRKFTKCLENIFEGADSKNGKGGESANKIRKRYVEARLRSSLSVGHDYSSIGVALGCWAIKMCVNGTYLFGTIKYETVKEYVNQVVNVLVEISCKHNFFQLDAEQFEYIYMVALKCRNIKDKTKLLNNIKDFHHFMVLSRLAPELDWADHYHHVRSNRIASSVDAGFITPEEYERTLLIVESCHESGVVSIRLAMFYSAIVICGYRFGLRISESEHLQYRDIQHNNKWSSVVVNVCNTYFDDTKSLAGRRQVPLIGRLSGKEKRILKCVFSPSNIEKLDPAAAVFTEEDCTRDLFDTAKAAYVINCALKQVTGDDGAHSHWLRHSFPSRIYPKYYSNNDDWYGVFVKRLSGQYIDNIGGLRKLMTGRKFPSHWDIKSLSVALGHADVSTTFSNYIHTADVHLQYCMGMQEHWGFKVKCIDHITSYLVPDARFETLKKQRVRDRVGSNDLLGALKVAARNGKFSKSNLSTKPHPREEKIEIEINEGVLSQSVSLQQIDDILLLAIIGDDASAQDISERLFINTNTVDKVLTIFKQQQDMSGYNGYQSQSPSNTLDSNRYDYESSSETLSLRTFLIELSQVLNSISEEQRKVLEEGVSVWSKCYYPNPHYRQIIFDDPGHLVKFIDAMNILLVPTTEMQVTALNQIGTWYKIVSDGGGAQLSVYSEDIVVREYEFHKSKITQEIPRSSSKGKLARKERVSVSLSRNSKHRIHYPRRLHRLIFLVSIWMNMVDL